MPSGLEARDTVHVSAIGLKPYRDPGYTKILDDWPEADDLIRSPKYIFHQNDPIYFEVKGPVNPKAAGEIKNLVKVTPSTFIKLLTLQETGINTSIFRTAPDEKIYLLTFQKIKERGFDDR